MSTRIESLYNKAMKIGFEIERQDVGRRSFFSFKKGKHSVTEPMSLGVAESWLEGYLAALEDIDSLPSL